VVDAEVAVGHAPTKFDDRGALMDEAIREQLLEVVNTLLAEVPSVLAVAS
jgi:hypothetical protein